MKCFTADFLRFFTEKRLDGWMNTRHQSIAGFFLKFSSFLRFYKCFVQDCSYYIWDVNNQYYSGNS